jgi:hypothetical protein
MTAISNRQLQKIEWKVRQKAKRAAERDALKKNAYGKTDLTPYNAITGQMIINRMRLK